MNVEFFLHTGMMFCITDVCLPLYMSLQFI